MKPRMGLAVSASQACALQTRMRLGPLRARRILKERLVRLMEGF
jgi:hypothetical protein